MEEQTEYLKLPIEEQCVHKLWKARLHGYEELTKLFRKIDDEKSPEFAKYLGLVKKFVVDSNAVAQEKGLEAVLAYVENYALAGKSVGEVISGIISKCIAAPKAKTKSLSVQIILMYIEIEKQEAVQEELLKGMDHKNYKNPKIVAACVSAMTQALNQFGVKVINVKPLIQKIPDLLEDRDSGVRQEAKALVVEMFKWLGPAVMKPQLNSLKPIQVTELEEEFEKVKADKVIPSRYLKSEKQKQAKIAVESAAAGDDDDGGEDDDGGPAEIDPYDFADPVDILSKLPKDFYEKLEEKKWQERKKAIDSLEELLHAPKLQPGDYGDLVRALKKIISKDTNVMIVAIAGKCLASIANGLKKHFQPYAGACIPAILEKFREKKQNVVIALREAADAVYASTSVEAIQEDVLASFENKNPSVRAETASFLARCFTRCTPVMLNKKILKAYTTVLLKLLNDQDPTVRDNAADALGTAMKVVGEKAIMVFLNDIEAIKMTKIKECCDKAVITAKIPKNPAQSRPSTAPAKLARGDADRGPEPPARPVAKAAPKRPTTAVTKKLPPKKANSDEGRLKASQVPAEREMADEEVEEKASQIFSEEVLTGLCDSNWKTRLAAVEQYTKVVREMNPGDINAQVLLKTMNKKPGLKDTNFQVLKGRLEAVKVIAESASMSSTAANSCIEDIAEKLGDPKNGALAGDVLTAIAESTSLEIVASRVMDFAFNQKSPKIQMEALNWLANAIKEFGFVIQPKPIIDHLKKGIQATNPTVRTAAISFCGVLYLYMGQQLSMLFETEKPAVQQQIQAEFDKHSGEAAPVPTRGTKANTVMETDEDVEVQEEVTVNVRDLMPRVDISSQITESIITELGDKNWKVRSEALQKVSSILSENKFITGNLGDLPQVLAQRLVDSNTKITTTAISLSQDLCAAMGASSKEHVKILFPSMLQNLGDGKPAVRTAARGCIDAWVEQCGVKCFFDGEMIGDALKTGNQNLRIELWAWLAEKLPNIPKKTIQKDELVVCLPHLYASIEDRSADVRKNAQDAVLPFMLHLGYDAMVKATDKLKPGSKAQVILILDKTRPNLPQQITPPVKKTETIKAVKSGVGLKITSGTKTITKGKSQAPAKTVSRKKGEEEDIAPLLQSNNMKHQRSLDEHHLKVLKWNFTTPREEFVELLKELMLSANVNKTLITNMFHVDFRYHLKAIESLNEFLPCNPNATVANLDLILKWMTLRFFDTNPSVLLKSLEYLQTVFSMLITEEYNMFDNEASSFVPYLILKIGDPKDAVRNSVRSLFKQLECLYPVPKLFSYAMEGLKSKNARQRTECLDLLGSLIENYGLSSCQPSSAAALKEIAKQISDRDNTVRNAALNCVVAAYFLEGDKVYKMIGQISDKDMSLLEERIKRAAKNRPPPGSRPPPGKSEQASSPPSGKHVQESSENLSKKVEIPVEEEEEEREELEHLPSPVMRNSAIKPRPISGPFGLNTHLLEQIEQDCITVKPPVLAEYDLGDISVEVPSVVSAEELVETTISEIASADLKVACKACIQVECLLQSEKGSYIIDKEDHLILSSVLQLRLLSSSDKLITPIDLLGKGYRHVFMVLMTFYLNPQWTKHVSKDVLKDLIDELLQLLANKKMEELDNAEAYVRVLNVLTLRIIENSDHTNVTCAFIKSLYNCVGNSNCSPRLLELVMKCLWKIVKLLPAWEEDTDFGMILYEIHLFLKDYPSSMWKKRPTNTPVKTIKTLLHTMTKIKGNKILLHLGRIDNINESELHSYLMKLIKAVKQEDTKQVLPKKDQSKSQHRLSKVMHERLSDIFKKIGSKDQTKEGLELLYDFKQQHPEADIEPFLSKSSKFFQEYIEKGLKEISIQRKQSGVTTSTASVSSFGSQENVITQLPLNELGLGAHGQEIDANGESLNTDYYLERLNMWKKRAGFEEEKAPSNKPTTQSFDNRENENLVCHFKKQEEPIVPEVSQTSHLNLSEIRKRIDAFKNTT